MCVYIKDVPIQSKGVLCTVCTDCLILLRLVNLYCALLLYIMHGLSQSTNVKLPFERVGSFLLEQQEIITILEVC